MHKQGNEKEYELFNHHLNEGKKAYSISKINTFNTCNFEFYKTYIEKVKGEGNIYTEVGTFIHDTIERYYRGDVTDDFDFTQAFHNKMLELEIQGIDFPNELIKNSFMNDIIHFTKNFKMLKGQFTLEKMFVILMGNSILRGFIDAIRVNEDGSVEIIDWKTSSKFSGSKLIEAGRQLIIYKLALEEVSGMTIDKISWNMLKYIYVCHKQKNGKIKQKMVNRGKLIKEMKNAFEKEMLAAGMLDFEVTLLLEEALQKNDISILPSVITDKYWLEDCLLEYEVTEERVEEVKQYIMNTIKEIESMDKEDEGAWEPLNIEKENFYCNTLCNHRLTCKHFLQYKKDNPFKKIGF